MSKLLAVISKDAGDRKHKTGRVKKNVLDEEMIAFVEEIEGTRAGRWFKLLFDNEEGDVSTENKLSEHWLKLIVEVDDNTQISKIKDNYRITRKEGSTTVDMLTRDPMTNRKIKHINVNRKITELGADFVKFAYLPVYNAKCNHCGDVTYREFTATDNREDTICSTCLANRNVCTHCSAEYYGNSSVEGYCQTCAPHVGTCPTCGESHYLNHRETTRGGVLICRDCYAVAQRCDICSIIVDPRDVHENEDSRSGCLCGNCYEQHSSSRAIRNYSYKPAPDFRKMSDEKLCFGVELELNVPERNDPEQVAREVKSTFRSTVNDGKLFYCKSDSSIGHGFELVTHPFSMDWLNSDQQTISDLFKILNGNGCKAGKRDGIRSCGMHVHMSKEAFTDAQIFKYLMFVYNNKNFMQYISDRTDASWVREYCRFETSAKDLSHFRKISKTKRNDYGLGHKTAIQLTESTIEFRVFNSTMVEYEFIRNIQFCQALYEFTKTNHTRKMHYKYFIEFVNNNRARYSNLATFTDMYSSLATIGSVADDEYPEILKKHSKKGM